MRIILFIVCLVLFTACEGKKKDYAPMENKTDQLEKKIDHQQVVVKEVQQASGYTYLLVTDSGKDLWLAVSKTEAAAGDKLYYYGAMEMKNFESKELNRVFDEILFVDQISPTPLDPETMKAEYVAQKKAGMQKMLDSIRISPAPNGQTIQELYENTADYNQKKVIVRGQVIKVNKEIMDRNWVHLMDGTKGDRSDLTFTTKEVVQVGDTITFEGVLAIDREFGEGYVYPVIVEDAVLINP